MTFFSHNSESVYSSSHAWSSASVCRSNVDSRAVRFTTTISSGVKRSTRETDCVARITWACCDADRINPARTSMA